MRKHILILIIFASLLFHGCSLIEKTYRIGVANDIFISDVAIYLDGEKRTVLGLPYSDWNNHLQAMSKDIYDVKEGNHIIEVKCNGQVYKSSIYIDQDMQLKVSDLTGIDPVC